MDFLYFSGVKLNHFFVYYCHSPLPDWIADVEELDMAVGMAAQQKMQESLFIRTSKNIQDSYKEFQNLFQLEASLKIVIEQPNFLWQLICVFLRSLLNMLVLNR